MNKFIIGVVVGITILVLPMIGLNQDKVVLHDRQIWLGYITSTKISEDYSIWNDIHYVPESFAIIRTGVTRKLSAHASATAGYAYLRLPYGGNVPGLRRSEHRPWAQLQFNVPGKPSLTYNARVRYDARFKENITEADRGDEYTFNHRVRFLIGVRKNIGGLNNGLPMPYLSLSNETLLNFGRSVTFNTFDQNRLCFFFGIEHGSLQYQAGLMNRFVQIAPSKYVLNYTLVFWVIQKFKIRSSRTE